MAGKRGNPGGNPNWAKGMPSANPFGRPPAHNTARKLLDAREPELWTAILDKAINDGDPSAMRICAERCEPPRKKSRLVPCSNISEMLKGGASFDDCARELIRMSAASEIDVDDADQLLGLINTGMRMVKPTESTDIFGGLGELMAALEGDEKALFHIRRLRAHQLKAEKDEGQS